MPFFDTEMKLGARLRTGELWAVPIGTFFSANIAPDIEPRGSIPEGTRIHDCRPATGQTGLCLGEVEMQFGAGSAQVTVRFPCSSSTDLSDE